MVCLVVMAEDPELAERVVAALRGDNRIEVTRVVSDQAAREAQVVREAVAAAAVLVIVPDRPADLEPWRNRELDARSALVVADLLGRVVWAQALAAGARGYLGPLEGLTVLRQRVLAVSEGELAFPPGTMEELQAALRQVGQEEIRRRQLRPIEVWLMQRIALGETAHDIAVRLKATSGGKQPSDKAVYSRIRRLRERLEVANEAAVARLAGEWGLLWGEAPEDPPDEEAR